MGLQNRSRICACVTLSGGSMGSVTCLFLHERQKGTHLHEDRLCTFVLEVLTRLWGKRPSHTVVRTSDKAPGDVLGGLINHSSPRF